ncbi:MAG: hypothetical protein DRQ48_01025 [Gammaproteobacteria bacterium]|nr:MAG: hypothetical protein DRQ44_00345 [Gammaproteobacteria bacterium]RKZ72262.1 MAG: hypothetical protein DRQ48_01025 [Gammaproteobacteria bacterium]
MENKNKNKARYGLVEIVGAVKEGLEFETTSQAAAYLGVSVANLYRWTKVYGDVVTDERFKTIDDMVEHITKAKEKAKIQKNKIRKIKFPKILIGETVPDKIKYIVNESGCSQADIHQLIGMSKGGFYKLMNYDSKPSSPTIDKLVLYMPYKRHLWEYPTTQEDFEVIAEMKKACSPNEDKLRALSTDIEPEMPEVDSIPVETTREVKEANESLCKMRLDINDMLHRLNQMQDAQLNMMSTVMQCMSMQQQMMATQAIKSGSEAAKNQNGNVHVPVKYNNGVSPNPKMSGVFPKEFNR